MTCIILNNMPTEFMAVGHILIKEIATDNIIIRKDSNNKTNEGKK